MRTPKWRWPNIAFSGEKWMVILPDVETKVGWVELSKLSGPDRDDLQLGYPFSTEQWGHEYATESARRVLKYAFDVLHLDRLAAIARPANLASLRVLAKLGFRKVGERTDEGVELCGEYPLTLEEWRRGRSA